MHVFPLLLVLAVVVHEGAFKEPRGCGFNEVPGDSCKTPEKTCQDAGSEQPVCRKCVCKEGFVRTAFGECVAQEYCDKCKGRENEDYQSCGTACPHVCKVTVPDFCTKQCVGSCFCLAGYVRSSPDGPCVPWEKCPPLCKANMEYAGCLSNCPAVCNQTEPRFCNQVCFRDGCKCKEGFLLDPKDINTCVLASECTNTA